jgi:hypothetical protein
MMQLQRAEGCLTDLTFDAWSSGELNLQVRERAQAHVSTCERCRRRQAELDAVRKEFYAAAPSFKDHTQHTRPKPSHPASKWILPLALAAAIALILTPGLRPGTRQKGGPSLGYYVKRGEHVFEGDRDTALRPGDLIRFTCSSQEPRYLALFGWDSHSANIYFPANSERATRVQSRADVGLDFSVELDAAPSDEQVHGLFCQSSYELRPLLTVLRETGQLPVPPDCQKNFLSTTTNAYDADVRVHHAWDLSFLTFELGLGGGLSLFTQDFETRGVAPNRRTLIPFVALGGGALFDIWNATYLTLDAAAETHFMRLRPDSASPAKLSPQFALRISLGAGYHF